MYKKVILNTIYGSQLTKIRYINVNKGDDVLMSLFSLIRKMTTF